MMIIMKSKSSQSPLDAIKAALEEEEYLVHRDQVSPDLPVEQLFVGLFEDDEKRLYVLEVLPLKGFENASEAADEAEDDADIEDDAEEESELIQFSCAFPYLFDEAVSLDVLRLVNFVNTFLPMGHMSCAEAEHRVYFRYGMCFSSSIEAGLAAVIEVVGFAEYTLESISPIMVDVCEKKINFEVAVKKLIEIGFIPTEG